MTVQPKSFCYYACFALLSLAALGCDHPDYPLIGSALTPGANGDIRVEKEGKSRELSIVLDQLPPPQTISENATQYVLWVGSTDAAMKRVGSMKYDSQKRSGKIVFSTKQRMVHLLITAEPESEAQTPSEFVVAEQVIQKL